MNVKQISVPFRRASLMAVIAAAVMTAQPALARNDNDCGARAESEKGPKVKVIGLTADQRLVSFKECDPGWTRNVGFIKGLVAPPRRDSYSASPCVSCAVATSRKKSYTMRSFKSGTAQPRSTLRAAARADGSTPSSAMARSTSCAKGPVKPP